MNITRAHLQGTVRSLAQADQEQQGKLLEVRRAAEQLVGMTFFQTLLQTADSTALKGKYGHGGRGEEVFKQQMNAIFAERTAASTKFPLVDAVYDKMAQRYLGSSGDQNAGWSSDRVESVVE